MSEEIGNQLKKSCGYVLVGRDGKLHPCGKDADRHYQSYGFRCLEHPADGPWVAVRIGTDGIHSGGNVMMEEASELLTRVEEEEQRMKEEKAKGEKAKQTEEAKQAEKPYTCSYPGCEEFEGLNLQTGAGWRCRKHHGLQANAKTEEKERMEFILRGWWLGKASEEIDLVVPKAVEYGASDLLIMGEAMKTLVGRPEWSDAKGMEMACAFYALGKVARAFGAYERGETPSDDVWHDLGVYCRMAQKIRETGTWVETPKKEDKE